MDYLPASLTRESLGFSFVSFVFYISMFAALGVIMRRFNFLWATCKQIVGTP